MQGTLEDDARIDLRLRIFSATLSVRMAQLRLLLHLKRFRPDQPRIPRDYRYGGRWVRPDDDFGPPAGDGVRESLRYLLASSDPEDFEHIPEQLPLRPRERATLARRLARLLVESRPHAQSVVILARMGWLVDNVAHDIEAYFDPPKSLAELREAALNPKKGYDVHHVVEQGPARRDGFDDGRLQSGSNKVLIPRYKHWEDQRVVRSTQCRIRRSVAPRLFTWKFVGRKIPYRALCPPALWSVGTMRTNRIPELASETLLDEYLAVGLRQGQAIEEFDNRTYNRLYPKRRAIAAELLSRQGDHWRLLLPLLEHVDWQVRLNTAQDLRKVAPDESRRALETIDASNRYPYAADARLSLRPDMIFAGRESS